MGTCCQAPCGVANCALSAAYRRRPKSGPEGDSFHPHVHGLAAEGVFRPDGAFVALAPIPEALLEAGFRRAVLDFLVGQRAISEHLRERLLGWRRSGFSVHHQLRVAAKDAEGRKKLADDMLRAPLSLAKMRYDAASGTLNLALEDAPGPASHDPRVTEKNGG